MTARKKLRIYQWEDQCPMPNCPNMEVKFLEMTIESVDDTTLKRSRVKEILYDHPLKVQVANDHGLFELVFSKDYKKFYPGVKCNQCHQAVEDHFIHSRFITHFHSEKNWDDTKLDASLILDLRISEENDTDDDQK